MNKKIIIIITLSIFIFSCRKKTENATTNRLNLSLSTHIDSVDPARSYDAASARIVYNTYEQLYQYHYLKRPLEIIPLLADGMPTYDSTKKIVTIKIKKNIKYHPNDSFDNQTRFVKSEDFETQIKRLLFPGTRSTGGWLLEDKLVGVKKFKNAVGGSIDKLIKTKIEGVQTPDDHTLILKLRQPYPQLKYVLAMSFISPIPKEALVKFNNNFENHIIGTGPFMLSNWIKNSKIVLQKFKDYHENFYPQYGDRVSNESSLLRDAGKKIPFIDMIQFNIIKESQTRWLNFLSKKIDLLELPKDNFSSVIDVNGKLKDTLEKKGIAGQLVASSTYYWFAFNMSDPLLGKNLFLRKAISHAINRDRFIKIFTNNTGLKANSLFPPGVFGHSSNTIMPISYDLNKAKQFLKLAGYPNGKGLPEIVFDTRNPSTTSRQEGEFIKSELSKIGIKIKINTNNFPTFLKKARQGDLQFWKGGWIMDYLDPENSLQLLYSNNKPPGPNSSSFDNAQFDRLFEKISTLNEGLEKLKRLNEIEQIFFAEVPWLVSHYERYYILNHKRLENFRYSDSIPNLYKYLKLNPKYSK